jgi:hypothetical protein
MKYAVLRLPRLLILAVPLLVILSSMSMKHDAPDMAPMQAKWVKLGDRTVNYTVDHSEIVIEGTQEGLNALRVKVTKGAINLHGCRVTYKNGQTADIDVLNSIPQGGESKVIDLPASEQAIVRITFWYDMKNRAVQQTTIEIWGRK